MFKRIKAFFKRLFSRSKQERQQRIQKAFAFIRKVLANPALDIAVELTRNPIDNAILKIVRVALGVSIYQNTQFAAVPPLNNLTDILEFLRNLNHHNTIVNQAEQLAHDAA